MDEMTKMEEPCVRSVELTAQEIVALHSGEARIVRADPIADKIISRHNKIRARRARDGSFTLSRDAMYTPGERERFTLRCPVGNSGDRILALESPRTGSAFHLISDNEAMHVVALIRSVAIDVRNGWRWIVLLERATPQAKE